MRPIAGLSNQASSTFAFINYWAALRPGHRALIYPGQEVAYGQLRAIIARHREILYRAGVRAGLRVAVGHASPLVHLTVVLACESLGAATLSFQVGEMEFDASSLDGFDFVVAERAIEGLPSHLHCLVLDVEALRAAAQMAEDSLAVLDEQAWHPEAIRRIARTSGSTGKPKRLQFPSRVIDNWLNDLTWRYGFASDSVTLATTPLAVNATYTRVLAVLRAGATMAFGSPWEIARRVRIDYAWYIPATLMAALGDEPDDPPPAPVIRSIHSAGSGLSSAQRSRVLGRFAGHIENVYGSNEVCLVSAFVDASGVGILGPAVDVRVCDASRHELPVGEVGELWLRTPNVLDGYWEDAPELNNRFVEGWFRSGDLGRLLQPRVLQVMGRHDDVLNLDGIKKTLGDAEEVFLSDPRVHAVGIVRVGEGLDSEVVAALELRKGQVLEQVVSSLHRRFPAWVRAIRTMQLNVLPRNSGGKLDRLRVRDLYLQAFPIPATTPEKFK